MINMHEWAIRWGIPYEAVQDLRNRMNAVNTSSHDPSAKPGSEAAAQNAVRLEASKIGARLWRNNVGACCDEHGNFFRYGLANDTKAMNEVVKSSDLIGFKPTVVCPHHVGQTWGVFTAREIKEPGWTFTGTPREQAQLRFIELLVANGCDACFATGEGTL